MKVPGSTAPDPRDPHRGGPRVIIADCGVDACLVTLAGEDVLILSPNQTFTSAVAAAGRVLAGRGVDEDAVRSLVRWHFPRAAELDLDMVLPGYSDRWVARALAIEEARSIRLVVALVVLILVVIGASLAYSLVDLDLGDFRLP